MKITSKINIQRIGTGEYMLNGTVITDIQDQLQRLHTACRAKTDEQRLAIFQRMVSDGSLPYFAEKKAAFISNEETVKNVMQEIINFFSEFQFTPSFRFVNTLCHKCVKGVAPAYITNYFRLIDSPYAAEIEAKIASPEFKYIIKTLSTVDIKKTVNNRLKIFFGPQGTGKTTAALRETDNLTLVCNSSILPADLMEDFAFDDGKATFHPSILARCMEEGKPIVLDEINLLPYDTLRFLQGILDDKKEINYKGHTVHINDGFKIIGTMNLTVNGVTYGLPEPLADRCFGIDEYLISADQLMSAIF